MSLLSRCRLPPRLAARFASSSSSTVAEIREEFRGYRGGEVRYSTNPESRLVQVSFCQAGRKNALSGQMMAELNDVAHELQNFQRRGGKGFILYARYDPDNGGEVNESGGASRASGRPVRPRIFCSGGDLGLTDRVTDEAGGRRTSALMQDTAATLRSLSLVSACVVDGRAIGGGAELALATDFRVFCPVRGQLAFVQADMGLATGSGGGARLVELMGERAALRSLLTCAKFDADAAEKAGLCDRRAKDGQDALLAAEKFLFDLTGRLEPEVVQAAKKICRTAAEVKDYREALMNEAEAFAPLWTGPAHMEAIGNKLKH